MCWLKVVVFANQNMQPLVDLNQVQFLLYHTFSQATLVTQSMEINYLFHFDFKDAAMGVTVLLNFNIWRSNAIHCLTFPLKQGVMWRTLCITAH